VETSTLGDPTVILDSGLGDSEIPAPDPVKDKGKLGTLEVPMPKAVDDDDDGIPFSAKWERLKTKGTSSTI
ncbi:hypothetical protein HAX54_015514, partial [Datura stramonium]|nr:hypothetical protein [Datura stramonium]